MAHSLLDDLLRVFARTCEEGEFDVAEHLLRAIEAVTARQQHDAAQLDAAYVLLAKSCSQIRGARPSKKKGGGN
ncbi:hypothetical protein NTJ56_13885 [Burkholderia contaminans]|uniref:hypothetical protein n=1 Tax=Burkholderia contaminans TaxID=488447 RepID=UPI001CF5A2A2|nr:hypothetical protein [Burkholderia contaminans]MCA7914610.1 hypothetical protein [Burkholderia contaminans]UUX36427.1 hypothetical protein NTJ56_13885 [Burkholderia contaminans]